MEWKRDIGPVLAELIEYLQSCTTYYFFDLIKAYIKITEGMHDLTSKLSAKTIDR
jgi:hypothetical protein